MEFKYSTASDHAITVRGWSSGDISDWIRSGDFAGAAPWITFPLSKVAYAIGHEEDGWDGRPKRYATFVLDCGERVNVVEDEGTREALSKTMWKNVFGPTEGETNEDD